MYATRGPWFGGPFTSAVTTRPAGTVTFALSSVTKATLTYSVDGITVSKALQRQTWTNENYTGTYAAGYSIQRSQCSPSSLNGLDEEVGTISVNQSGTTMSMVLAYGYDTCTFSGTYEQAGKLVRVQGTYRCGSGVQGTFDAIEMTPAISGFTARVRGQNQYCQWSGFLGGIARAQ
jgi:hypothetical protein